MFKSIYVLIVFLFLFSGCDDGKNNYERGRLNNKYTRITESSNNNIYVKYKRKSNKEKDCININKEYYNQIPSKELKDYYCKIVSKYGNIQNARLKYLPENTEDLLFFLLSFYYNWEEKKIIPISGKSRLHIDRNKYNKVPSNITQISNGKDNDGGEWTQVMELYHGDRKTYRGVGNRVGCQVSFYKRGGNVDDTSGYRGTFDYAFFIIKPKASIRITLNGILEFFDGDGLHTKWDISPHNENKSYSHASEIYY